MKMPCKTACLAATLLLVACDGDDASECEAFGEEVCALACDCTEGDECAVIAGAVTLTFEDPSDCAGFYGPQVACQDGGDPDFDYAGCTELLDQAMCVDTEDGAAIELPDC